MARRFGTATTDGKILLTATVAKTILQVKAPANQDVAVIGWSVTFNGISGTAEPPLVELVQQSDAGTMTSITIAQDDQRHGAMQSTAAHTATVEPTTTVKNRVPLTHPQDGFMVVTGSDEVVLAGGGRLGIRVTAPNAVHVSASISIEE